MKYVIFLVIFVALVIGHGFFFQDAGEKFSESIREKQYFWIIYFFMSHIVTEAISKRVLK